MDIYRPREFGIATRERIMAAIERLTSELGRSPAPQEVATDLAMKRPTLHRHIDILAREGRVRKLYSGSVLEAAMTHPPRDIAFHLTLSEQDRELLDALAHRMGVSRTETISRALHLLNAVQERQGAAEGRQAEQNGHV